MAIHDGAIESIKSMEAAALELLKLKDEQRHLETEITAIQSGALYEFVKELDGKRSNEDERAAGRDGLLKDNGTYQQMVLDAVDKRNEIAVTEITVRRTERLERWARLDAAFMIGHDNNEPDWLKTAGTR
jgi:hypothetical protein